jgi:hemin uptake protein HemP
MSTNQASVKAITAAADETPRLHIGDILRVSSQTLLGKRGEIIIEHAGREYRLRRTSTGKLILTA